ncbi:hypothetical protein TRVA0_012S02828 [Trichomonascus vanleenenianus]|uniref:uncharacterized protein n=1 Tax=Trichomonascus vanleenenianus TaxID=2268995 RepID=UPI003ECA573E
MIMTWTGSRLVQVALLGFSVIMFLVTISYFIDHEKIVDKTQWKIKSQQPTTNMTGQLVTRDDQSQNQIRIALIEQDKLVNKLKDEAAKVVQDLVKGEQQYKADTKQRKKVLENLMRELKKQGGTVDQKKKKKASISRK